MGLSPRRKRAIPFSRAVHAVRKGYHRALGRDIKRIEAARPYLNPFSPQTVKLRKEIRIQANRELASSKGVLMHSRRATRVSDFRDAIDRILSKPDLPREIVSQATLVRGRVARNRERLVEKRDQLMSSLTTYFIRYVASDRAAELSLDYLGVGTQSAKDRSLREGIGEIAREILVDSFRKIPADVRAANNRDALRRVQPFFGRSPLGRLRARKFLSLFATIKKNLSVDN